MKWITPIGTSLALVVGVVAADAQGVGYGPGVNPSNPQDLTYRSNPQDLLVPGASNPQDLVRRPPGVPRLRGPEVPTVPTSRSMSPTLQYTVKTKPSQKPLRQDADVVASGNVPRINAEATCRASEDALIKLFGDKTMVTFESCMRQEKEAVEQIQKGWATFTASARQRCIQPKNYMPSYVEWLTCLENDRHLRELRAKEAEANPSRQVR